MVICLHNVGGEDSWRWRDQLGGRGWDVVGFPRLGWGKWGKRVREILLFKLPLPVPAMSSYLFIIKSELPLVIGTFLEMDPNG